MTTETDRPLGVPPPPAAHPAPATPPPAGVSSTATRRTVAVVLVVAAAAFLAAFVVLGSAVSWPASLDLAADEALPLVAAERSGLLVGYTLYLAYSVAFVPLAVLLPRALGLPSGPLVALAVAVGVASGILRALGIARWLTVMPVLSDTYVEAPATSATREAAAVTYTALNEYAGGLGELLGVGLAGGVWLLLVSVALVRLPRTRWLVGIGVAAGLTSLTSVVVVEVGTASPVLILAWFVLLAVRLWPAARPVSRPAPSEEALP